MRKLDVRRSDLIVVYDKLGMLSAPRAFWLFKTFGIPNVKILNGTYSKWLAEGREIEKGDNETAWRRLGRKTSETEDFRFELDEKRIRFYEEMVKIGESRTVPILDSRFASVFTQGNVPSSVNVPFPDVLNPDKTYKSVEALTALFQQHSIKNPAGD